MSIEQLFIDVFNPDHNDVVVILVDVPHAACEDNIKWSDRRLMAKEWHDIFFSLQRKKGLSLLPLIEFPSSGAHAKQFPLTIGTPFSIEKALEQATLALALTEYSISPLLMNWGKSHQNFRSASLPTVEKRMESTALSADYKEIYNRCINIEMLMQNLKGANVIFSTKHHCYFDLRFRTIRKDAGRLHRGDSPDFPFINLPSGEVYMAPYEGEKNITSETCGTIPAFLNGESVLFTVKKNKIVDINDFETSSTMCKSFFQKDPARNNIAEFAIGCNSWAEVTGNVLEDEKAGFHWAFGRSEHIGGVVTPSNFLCAENVVHQDVVYAKNSKYKVDFLEFIYNDGSKKTIIDNSDYLIF